MTAHLSPSDRRALMVGAIAIAFVAALGRGIPAALHWGKREVAAAENGATQASRDGHLLEQSRATSVAYRTAQSRLAALDSSLVPGQSAADIAAGLSEIVTASADVADLHPETMELTVDSTTEFGLLHVRSRTQVTGDLFSIATFLESLEEGPALLCIRELSLVRVTDPAISGHVQIRADLLIEGIARRVPAAGRRS